MAGRVGGPTTGRTELNQRRRRPKKRDLYIALADRWRGTMSGAEFESGMPGAQKTVAAGIRTGNGVLPHGNCDGGKRRHPLV